MSERKNTYEGLFLIAQTISNDMGAVVARLNEVLGRAKAEVISMKKWDERRLAYEINKQKRGLFILTYFSCDPATIEGITRDVNLSDDILRCMIIRADHLTLEEMQSHDERQALADEAALKREDTEETEETEPASAEA